MKNNKKWAKLMKLGEKYCKIAFFWRCDFWHFFGSQKIKKSNHQKCKNLIKRCQIFIAACQRRVLNSFFGPPEPLRKMFFSCHRDADLSKFSFFAKNNGKIIIFVIFEISKIQNVCFFIGFSTKMSWDKIPKNKFCIKTNRKLRFLHFSQPQKFKNHDFSMVFCKKWKFWRVSNSMARKIFPIFDDSIFFIF